MKQNFFSRNEQRFYPTEIGNLPSVTTILKLLAKPALIQWATNKAAESVKPILEGIRDGAIMPETLDVEAIVKDMKKQHKEISGGASNIGTVVHGLVSDSFMLPGWEGWKEQGLVPEEATMAWDAFVSWRTNNEVEPVAVEFMVWSKLGFAGTLDIYARVKGHLTLIDIKVSDRVYQEHSMQLGAYGLGLKERMGAGIEAYANLLLGKTTGVPTYVPYDTKEIKVATTQFLLLNKFWHLQNDTPSVGAKVDTAV